MFAGAGAPGPDPDVGPAAPPTTTKIRSRPLQSMDFHGRSPLPCSLRVRFSRLTSTGAFAIAFRYAFFGVSAELLPFDVGGDARRWL